MILALDIGGTSVKMGLADEQGVLYEKAEADVSFDGYQTPIIDTVVQSAVLFLARHNVSICGVGVSATGQIDDRSGVVIGTNGKIPHYEETPIKEKLEQALGAPVWALNDANAAALGECAFGGGRGCRNAVFITLGTGVGGGLVLDGRLYGGARGIAGELGHFTLYQEGPACPCGKRGCFEHYASVTALIRRAHEAAPETEWNGRKIFERAVQEDAVLLRVLETWIDDIAAGLTGLVHLFNPEAVLIGGGGKTTLTSNLIRRFGDKVCIVHHDNYYRAHDDLTYEERTRLNYDCPEAFETEMMIEHLRLLKQGRSIHCPVYDFKVHNRSGETIEIEPRPVILVEGILIFADPALSNLMDIRVFVDADADVRLARRVLRDTEKRGRTVRSVVEQWQNTVKPMHEKYVEPSKKNADIIVPQGGKNPVALDLIVGRIQRHLDENA